MKKISIYIAIVSIGIFCVSNISNAYVVKPGDTLWKIAQGANLELSELLRLNPQIKNKNLIFPNQEVNTDTALGAISRPELFYSENITRGLSLGGSETEIYVSALPNETTGYLIINPQSSSNRELIKYTGVTTTGGNQLTGVTRGLAEYGTTGVIISDSRVTANVKRHSSGEQIIMSNGRYEQNIIDQLNGLATSSLSITDQNFTAGGGTVCLTNSSVCLRNSGGALQWSIDGFANSYNFTSSSVSQLSASSSMATKVVSSEIGVIVSSSMGMYDGADGQGIYQKASSTGGILQDSDGMYITTSSLSDAGIATSTPTAGKMPIANASSSLYGWGSKFGGNGSDGSLSVTTTNSTTTLDIASSSILIKNYTSLFVTSTGVLTFQRPTTTGSVVVLRVMGDCTINGTINVKGMGADGGVATTSYDGGYADGYRGATGTAYLFKTYAGLGGIHASAGGAAGVIGSLAYSTIDDWILQQYNLTFVGAGGGGGAGETNNPGGIATGGKGGKGGGALILECGGNLTFTGTILANGQNGDAGTITNNFKAGGGGGGGGGFVAVLYNQVISNTGTINVSGGTGGACNSSGYGGGGGGSLENVGTAGGTSTGGTGGAGKSFIKQNLYYY